MTAVADPKLDDLPDFTSDAPLTVIEAVRLAIREVEPVEKSGWNAHDKYNFRGVDDVVTAARKVFARIGIVPMPIKTTTSYRDVQSSRGTPMREATVTVTYRFWGPAGDHVDCEVPGESMDIGDKGTAKAMSVAFRTLLIQVLMLQTKDTHPDPDSESFERGDTAGAAAGRQSRESSRKELLETVTTLATDLRETLGVSEYDFNEWLVGVCQKDFGVDIAASRVDDSGPAESIDFGKLRDKQLQLAWTRLKRKLAQEKLARETGS